MWWPAGFTTIKINTGDDLVKGLLRTLLLGWVAACALAPTAAQAKACSLRPVQLVVPYAPGGSSDVIARTLVSYLSQELGVTIIFANWVGGYAAVGASSWRASADGKTLPLSAAGPLIVATNFYNKICHNASRYFVPAVNNAATPFLLVTNPSVPANNQKELTALVKHDPRKLTFSFSGSGGWGG